MQALARQRPVIKAVFSGSAGRGMLYEMRLGLDGTMPGAPYAELYAQIWDLCQGGQQVRAREAFSKLLLMINLEGQIPGVRRYVLKKRGVFKTTVSREREVTYSFAGMVFGKPGASQAAIPNGLEAGAHGWRSNPRRWLAASTVHESPKRTSRFVRRPMSGPEH
jgi:hypothetical protein